LTRCRRGATSSFTPASAPVAEERLRAARAQLSSISTGSPAAGSRLSLARESAAGLARRLAALAVRAPFDGVVYGLPRTRGEAVAPGQRVASVTDPDHPHVRFRVDQPDLPRVASGQRLLVAFNGLPDRQWEGTVRQVGGDLKEAGGRVVGEGTGEIADPGHALPLNAAVDVQLVVAEKRGVLIVPRAALRREGGQRVVYLLQQGAARRRVVEVGQIALAEVEITGGLAPGDPVIVDSPVPLHEGLRVRAAQP